MQTTVAPETTRKPGLFEGLTFYHWAVVILASCGWLFDCMGQRIFVLCREPAIRELLGAGANDGDVKLWGGMATCILMLGWGTGGLLFGMMSDRYGRVKAMLATLVAYTIFSAMSGFAVSVADFLIYRFLGGMGVGGMFGAATTLVAESVPGRFRTAALGSMQALSALGNMTAALLSLGIRPGQENFWGNYSGWAALFFVSVFPIFLAVPILLILKEPEPWKKAKAEAAAGQKGKSVGSIPELFTNPRWRHSTIIGICLGLAGMVGLWGIAFFSPELISTALKNRPLQDQELLKPAEICAALKAPAKPAIAHLKTLMTPNAVEKLVALPAGAEIQAESRDILRTELNRLIQEGNIYDAQAFATVTLMKNTANLAQLMQKQPKKTELIFLNRQLVEQVFPGAIKGLQKTIDTLKGKGTMLQDVGSLTGMFAFTFVAAFFNRRTAFLCAFLLCLGTVSFVFYSLKTETQVYWMLPMVGFSTLAVFAGYSIYFPEIFPTRLRGTGVGFCYNTVRFLTAPFPFIFGWLSSQFPFRNVAVIMSSIYLIGIIALIWAPETKGKPLPED